MTADNFVSITGNLTRDPEVAFTASGQAYARLGVAVNRRWKKKDSDEWDESVSFFNVIAWGDIAEHVGDTVEKGNRVVVTGRLEQRSWENDDGDKKSAIQIVADEITPSLRWATAVVTKTEKAAGGGGAREDVPPVDEEPF